jgi:hypothetical protein
MRRKLLEAIPFDQVREPIQRPHWPQFPSARAPPQKLGCPVDDLIGNGRDYGNVGDHSVEQHGDTASGSITSLGAMSPTLFLSKQ